MSYRIVVWKDSDYAVGEAKESLFCQPNYGGSVRKEYLGVSDYIKSSRIIDELPFPRELLT